MANIAVRGRTAELAVIDEAIAALASGGSGGVLVLEGPPGIGKTRLAEEFAVRAQSCGIRTLTGQAFEHQQSVPFYALFAATLHANPPVGDAEALRRAGGSVDLRYWVVHYLRAAIHAEAAQRPLAILFEDIHWAHNATLAALRSLAMQADAPVTWLLTVRSGAGGTAVRETLAELQRVGATLLHLNALSPHAVADVVQDAVRAAADQSLLDLATKAHGSPFLLHELVRGLDEEGRLSIEAGRAVAAGDWLPRRLAVGMEQRLDGLSVEAATIVRIAATLPARFSAALLSAVLERPPSALFTGVQEAVRADLLAEDGEHLRFRHDLLREATRESLPLSLLRAMDRQSATTMLELGAAPEEVAPQLSRSAEVGDRAAVAALRQAAHSVVRSDPSAAADLSMRAVELLPADDSARGPLVAETVLLLNRATRYEEAQHLADSTLSTEVSQDDEAEIRLRLAAGNEDPEQRIAENRTALQLPEVNSVTRARHQAWLGYFETVNGMHTDGSVATRSAAAATASGDREAQIVSETALGMVDLQEGYPLRALLRMEGVDKLTRTGEATLGHIIAAVHRVRLVVTVGHLDEAGAQVAEHVQQAHRDGYAMALPPWTILDGTVHAAAGQLAKARSIIEALPPREWGNVSENNMMRMLVLSDIAARTGDRKLLQELVSEARTLYLSASPLVSGGAAYVVALAAWQRGDTHEAVRWLGSQHARVITPLWLNVFDQVVLMSRVALAGGDAGLRARALQSIEVLEREHPAAPLFDAVARYVRGLLERDPDALLAAADAFREWRPLLYAGAAEDAAEELSRTGRTGLAVEHFNAAFDTFVECEAVADARRVGRTLREFGIERRIVAPVRGRTSWDRLTDGELKVVSLIAEGATNRAVAEQLHLSPHTVKAHVRNAFAKLGINSRGQLSEGPSLVSDSR